MTSTADIPKNPTVNYFILSFGVFLLLLAGYEFNWRDELADEGEEIWARVIDWEESRDRFGKLNHHVRYQFTLPDEELSYRRKDIFGRDNLWSKIPEESWKQAKIDKKLKVVYATGKPSRSLPLSGLSQGRFDLWCMLFFGLLMITLALCNLWSARSKMNVEHGHAHTIPRGKPSPLTTLHDASKSRPGTWQNDLDETSTTVSRQEVNEIFPVDWRGGFKYLSILMSVMIIIGLTIHLGVLFFNKFDGTFRNVFSSRFLLVAVFIVAGVLGFSFLIALWFRLARITVVNGEIRGLNLWGFRNRIPLAEISALTPFENQGINGIVVHSSYHGKIFISDWTERLPELLSILDQYLPADVSDPHGFPRL